MNLLAALHSLLIKIHTLIFPVIQARHLSSESEEICNSYVEVNMNMYG